MAGIVSGWVVTSRAGGAGGGGGLLYTPHSVCGAPRDHVPLRACVRARTALPARLLLLAVAAQVGRVPF